jgi:hypothetical protein
MLANSTRPFHSTRVTSKTRWLLSLPGINSARNVSQVPAVTDRPDDRFDFAGRRLRMGMNQPSHAVGEQHIHFLRFDEGGNLAFAERRM